MAYCCTLLRCFIGYFSKIQNERQFPHISRILFYVIQKDKVTSEWRKLHNEELNDLYSAPNIIRLINSRRMRWPWHVARGRGEVLVRKPERKRSLGRPWRRWEDNIKMDLKEVGRGSMDWIELAQDRGRWRALVNAAMNLRVP
jgi:hypothetical protein